MYENHKYNVEIYEMITLILSKVNSNHTKIKVGGIKIILGSDEWVGEGYALEVMRSNDTWGYSISIGKSHEETYKNIYPEGIYMHYDSDGFYNLTRELGYSDDDDDKLLYDHLKKYCRNINIDKLLEH